MILHLSPLISILTALFLIGLPSVYYLMTRKKQTELTSWLIFYLAFKTTPYIFPMEHNFFRIIFHYRIYLNIIFLLYLAIELSVFIKKFRQSVKQRNNDYIDDYTFISNSLLELVKFKRLGRIIAFEVCSFYYCFFKWTENKNTETYYTGYKENGVSAIYIGLMFVSIVEAVAVHFLLILWNKNFAIAFLILHIYLLINIIGHLKAIYFRRNFITDEKIILSYGLFDTLEIPINTIDKISKYEGDYEKTEGLVKFAMLGKLEPHNISLELKDKMLINFPFGIIKNPKKILFYIDSPNEFIKTLLI